MEDTKKINKEQEKIYKDEGYTWLEFYLERYKDLVEKMSQSESVKVLDVGGGAGYFVKELERKIPKDVKLEIFLIDTNAYDTWNEENERIHYIEGDALKIDEIFAEKTFDYIFCNMVFHHIIGDSFKSSKEMRASVLSKMHKVLKDDGHIGIIDNFNDGLIIDSISCRIIYEMTTATNPIVVKICKKFGSLSAGVGVCMLSKKMWQKLIAMSNLKIDSEFITQPDKFSVLKKICLMNKRYSTFNLMVLSKK